MSSAKLPKLPRPDADELDEDDELEEDDVSWKKQITF
jgi:hypothetical protein